jgi:hypothetical protein
MALFPGAALFLRITKEFRAIAALPPLATRQRAVADSLFKNETSLSKQNDVLFVLFPCFLLTVHEQVRGATI